MALNPRNRVNRSPTERTAHPQHTVCIAFGRPPFHAHCADAHHNTDTHGTSCTHSHHMSCSQAIANHFLHLAHNAHHNTEIRMPTNCHRCSGSPYLIFRIHPYANATRLPDTLCGHCREWNPTLRLVRQRCAGGLHGHYDSMHQERGRGARATGFTPSRMRQSTPSDCCTGVDPAIGRAMTANTPMSRLHCVVMDTLALLALRTAYSCCWCMCIRLRS